MRSVVLHRNTFDHSQSQSKLDRGGRVMAFLQQRLLREEGIEDQLLVAGLGDGGRVLRLGRRVSGGHDWLVTAAVQSLLRLLSLA